MYKNFILFFFLVLASLFIIPNQIFAQGVTTASMNGIVLKVIHYQELMSSQNTPQVELNTVHLQEKMGYLTYLILGWVALIL